MYYHESTNVCRGFQFFDANEKLIVETCNRYFTDDYKKKETLLADDERIIGVKSFMSNPGQAYHSELQFVIGKSVIGNRLAEIAK